MYHHDVMKKTTKLSELLKRTTWTHRGYLVTLNTIRGEYHVSKDGAHITTTTALDLAFLAIDGLEG